MTYLQLRQKYPVFSFHKFEYFWEKNNLNIYFYYSCGELKFKHQITTPLLFPPNLGGNTKGVLEELIINLGLSILPSYWKLFCSPTIQIQDPRFKMQDSEINFWKKLFMKGMGEYYYKNQIDFTQKDFLKIISSNTPPYPSPKLGEGTKGWSMKKVLVPVGGGKDSIVTLELLKPHYQVTAFAINPVPLISEVIQTADVPAVLVQNTFDPQLFELNKQGYLNGHVPVSAFYAFCSLLTAHLQNIPYVAFSNEASSHEGNTTYLGQEINHQYSKTLEFETDVNNYLKTMFSPLELRGVASSARRGDISLKCFSFLRPLYELQITKLFCNYPQYFHIFSSCNNNFKINKTAKNLWCVKCPKCVSTALMLSQFIGKDQVSQIMGTFPNHPEIIDQLTGKSPVKPFECVLTRAEALACTTGQGLSEILNSWQNNPNMPEEFTKILKSAL